MKIVSQEYKKNIISLGKELDTKVTFTINGVKKELGPEELNSADPYYEGGILKSVMKELELDTNIEIPVGTEINLKSGIFTSLGYEYINYGNYIVYKSEKQEDTASYLVKCCDKILYSMKDYEQVNITYPATIRDYINAICNKLGIVFANKNSIFANYNKIIPKDYYSGLDYTFRDVLDELAQVTASTICLNNLDQLEIRYITDTKTTINEEWLKDVNVNFGKKYGPINSIVLSRAAESDNVYLKDDNSIAKNGLCELKIVDNQIMNDNNRSDYLPDILKKLNGLEYYLNDFSSTGITFYELCDRYGVQIEDKIYSCVMLNDDIQISQGLEENVLTEAPKETQTDYKKADKTDRKINHAFIIVDKKLNTIKAEVSEVQSDVNGVNSTINKVEERLTAQDKTIEIISTNIDRTTGEVREVTTTNGYKFSSEGLKIYKDQNSYNTQINNVGTYYRDGESNVSETTKDGSTLHNLSTKGQTKSSYNGVDYDFVEERIEVDGEPALATFWNGVE